MSKILIFGDSYLWGYSGGSQIKSYGGYLQDILGSDNVFTDGVNGAGFSTELENNFYSLVNSYTPSVSADSIDIVLFSGGFNDGPNTSDLTTVDTGMKNAIELAKSKYTNAKIMVAFIGSTYITGLTQAIRNALAIYQECGKYGASYITNSEYIMHNYKNYIDPIHPNDDGHQKLANMLVTGIETGSCDVIYQTYIGSDNGNFIFVEFLVNNLLSLSIAGSFEGSFTSETDYIDFGSIDKVLFKGIENDSCFKALAMLKITPEKGNDIYTHGMIKLIEDESDSNNLHMYVLPNFHPLLPSNNVISCTKCEIINACTFTIPSILG